MRFQVKQCTVELHYLFFAVIAFFLFTDTTGTALLGLAATILHEGGHFLVILWYAGTVKAVRFHAFVVDVEEVKRAKRGYAIDVLVSLAGPLANLVGGLFCALLYFYWQSPVLQEFIVVNGTLAAFHLLPVETLDGGQALYALLCCRYTPKIAANIVAVVSFLVLLPTAVLGFFLLLQSRYNFTLFFISIYLMILLVLKRGRFF